MSEKERETERKTEGEDESEICCRVDSLRERETEGWDESESEVEIGFSSLIRT